MRVVTYIVVVASCHSCARTAPSLRPPHDAGMTAVTSPGSQNLGGRPKRIESGPRPFPMGQMESHFASEPAREALTLYRWQEYEKARLATQKALAESRDGDSTRRLRILLASIDWELGRFDEAADGFASAALVDPLISDFLHYQAAQAYARAGDPRAARHVELVDPEGPWAVDMDFLRAGAAVANGNLTLAVDSYRAYIEAAQPGELLDQARYYLGGVLRDLGDRASGTAVWRKLVVSAPVSRWAVRVQKMQKDVVDGLTGAELMERGAGYFIAMRNGQSEADFSQALRRPDISDAQRCQALFHRAKSVYKNRDYRRSAPLFVKAIPVCAAVGDVDYEVKSSYLAGRAFSRMGAHIRSAKHYGTIESHREHSYADDARLRQAEELDSLQRDREATVLLSTLPGLYPNGDMKGEALWRLGWRAYRKGKYEEASSWLKKQSELVPAETNWWAEGQAEYWLGRSLGHLGRFDEASLAYSECIRRYPLSYYSMQAFGRLREKWPEIYEKVRYEVTVSQAPMTLSLRARSIYADRAFKIGHELARLGLAKAAKRQLAAIGFQVPENRDPVHDPEQIDWLTATALLLDLAGDYTGSHWIGRWHATDYRRYWPNGDGALRWRLAYPLAYWGLLQKSAAVHSYPPDLQMAIVREESAFDPALESSANAVGLTQMIFPTAVDHSVGSGILVTRENLQHPVKNVTIGAHFLESLQSAFDGRIGLMVPAYNAGRARVRGWIRRRSGDDLDEFIDKIAGDQARRYTKRVLGSFFAYRYLSTATIPAIRNEVPRRLGMRPSVASNGG